jgi:hypothetical protein
MTVLLVLLIAFVSAYTVIVRPLGELIGGVGALLLGIWGIRSILTGFGMPAVTAVDLSLALVILFVLASLSVRMLAYVEREGEIHLLQRERERAQAQAREHEHEHEHERSSLEQRSSS